jgi:Tfp pilus assembly protein PilF
VAVQIFLGRNFDQAIEQCNKTLELDPNFPVAYSVLAAAYAAGGNFKKRCRTLRNISRLATRIRRR